MLRAFFLVVLALAANPAIAQSWYSVEVLVFARDHGSSEEIWPADLQPRYASRSVTIGEPQASEYADPEALSALMPLVQRVAKAVKAATNADGLRLVQFNEAPAGQTVFHLHFHIIPVYEGTPLGAHAGGKADDAELAALARDIAAHL